METINKYSITRRALPPGLLAVVILLAAGFTRPILNLLQEGLGQNGFRLLIGACFVIGAGIFTVRVRPWRLGVWRLCALVAVAGAGAAYAFLVPAYPEERIHLLEYGLLGYLSFGLVRTGEVSPIERFGVPLLFGILVGGCDELLQFYLPDRVGDFRDIVFNSLGTIWGVALWAVINTGKSASR